MNGIEAGKAFVKFLLDDKDLKKGLAKVSSSLTKIGAIGTAATAPLVAGFTAATAAFISAGDELDKMSARTGFAAEALSELKYAAGQSGTSIGAIEKAAKKMQVGILDAAKGTGSLYESLEALGVNLESLKASTPEEQFLTLSKAVADVEDPTMRAALAQKVFGRAGTELLPMLAAGSAGIEQLRQRAHELGLVLKEEDATAAAVLGDNLDDLKLQLQAMAIQVGAAVAGPLTDFAKSLQPILAGGVQWIKDNQELVVLIAKVTAVVAAAGTGLLSLGVAINVATAAAGGLSVAMAFLTANPLVVAIAAIAEAILEIGYAADTTSERLLALGSILGGFSTRPDVDISSAIIGTKTPGAPQPPSVDGVPAPVVQPIAPVESPIDAAALASLNTDSVKYFSRTADASEGIETLMADLLSIAKSGRGGLVAGAI